MSTIPLSQPGSPVNDTIPPQAFNGMSPEDLGRMMSDTGMNAMAGSTVRPGAYTHPRYDQIFGDLDFYRQAYEGGRQFVANHLLKHPKERFVAYNRRLERAIYLNHVRVIVDTYASQLFKMPIVRPLPAGRGGEVLGGFWDDITYTGVSADEFYEETLQNGLQAGWSVVLIDRHEPDGQIVSRAQEQAAGRRPVAQRIDPLDLVDWHVDQRGEFEWAMVREWHPAQRKAPTDPYMGDLERFRLWTREGWILYRVELEDADEGAQADGPQYRYVELESGTHPCGEVPLVIGYFGRRRNREPIAESFIKDLAPLARRLLNLVSLIDEQINQHVFNLLVVGDRTFQTLKQVNFSPAGVLPWSKDEGQPFYLAPDVGQISVLRDEISKTESAIRFLSGIGRQNESSSAPSSGIALAYQTVDKAAIIKRFAQVMADFELRVSRMALRWMEVDADEVSPPVYKIELQPDEIEQELKDALKIASYPGQLPVEVLAENAAHAVRARFARTISDSERLDELVEMVRAGYSPSPRPIGGTFG
jgi:hypothetical protein